MSLLVTGGTGFVGRNLLLRALAEGREVHASVRNPEKLRHQLEFEKTDPSQIAALPSDPEKWPTDFRPREAVLGAGVLFARNRDEYFSTNVDWTLRLIRRLPEDCRVVLLSSQSAGGPTPAGKNSRSEADADTPITWYGESKLALERAIRKEFPSRSITILRPPMILGARDAATLPLFRMGRGPLRLKPGLKPKWYSFIAVDDLVDAIFATLQAPLPSASYYIASSCAITDLELLASAASGPGLTIPAPHTVVRLLSTVVDSVPALRARTPSLTRDRAREIWPDRWVVDASAFEKISGWKAIRSLTEAMQSAREYYIREGVL